MKIVSGVVARVVLCWAIVLIANEALAADKKINDSFVKDLDCATLSRDNVLSYAREEAFAMENHISISNHMSSGDGLQQCWALTLAQREFFYLLRFGVKDAGNVRKNGTLTAALDMAGNARRRGSCKNGSMGSCLQVGSERRVLKVRERSINDGWLRDGGLMTEMRRGDGKPARTFEHAMIFRQQKRFFDSANLYLIRDSRERSSEENKQTMTRILSNLAKKRLPLLVVRMATMNQHIVLVKSAVAKGENEFQLDVYDSNQPSKKVAITYSKGQFYAQQVEWSYDVTPPNSPVGIFIEDEQEMDELQTIVHKYYQKLCN